MWLHQKHPEGFRPRGVALRIQLCRVSWDKEPSPLSHPPISFVGLFRLNTIAPSQVGQKPPWFMHLGLCHFLTTFINTRLGRLLMYSKVTANIRSPSTINRLLEDTFPAKATSSLIIHVSADTASILFSFRESKYTILL